LSCGRIGGVREDGYDGGRVAYRFFYYNPESKTARRQREHLEIRMHGSSAEMGKRTLDEEGYQAEAYALEPAVT
jgi:hypothetical protein